jgi:serine protease Do
MDEVLLQDAIDRYLRLEMTQQERIIFEELRRTNPEVDQMVVAHSFFLQELERYGQTKEFKSALHEVESQLLEDGAIKADRLTTRGRIVNIWRRSQRTIAVAACIGGISALCISGIMLSLSSKPDKMLVQLGQKVQSLEKSQKVTNQQLNEVKTKIDPKAELKTGGTSFLIDGSGLLVTNAHVVKDVTSVYVTNVKGENFKARIVYEDVLLDIAILKIDDSDFRSVGPLPYGIKKNGADLGESVVTLGYPRNESNEVVVGMGYLSARTGYNGDTTSCQITVPANPGNSGGPVLNDKGEVIGIVSTKQKQEEGAVFALKSKNIYSALDSLKKDSTSFSDIHLSSVSTMHNLERVQQIKRIQDYVFLVKGY